MYLLKEQPEDFIVEEIPDRTWQQEGPYLVIKITKRERNTEEVINTLARQLRLPRNRLSYAGLKDKQALTTQYATIRRANPSQLNKIAIDQATITPVGYTNEPISLGNLKANRFTITLRNLDQLPRPPRFIPNYFDEQRFSTNNDAVGEALVKKNFQQACALINHNKIQEHLDRHPNDYVGALRRIPKKILSLYLNAYQSRLFNQALANLLLTHTPEELINTTLPLIGFGTTDLEPYEDILQQEHLAPRDFIIRAIPGLSTEGHERETILQPIITINKPLPDDHHQGKTKVTLTFTLPKGAYATNVIKHCFPNPKIPYGTIKQNTP